MKLILATNNAHKYEEFKQLMAGLDIDLIMQKDAGCNFEVEENGTTFEENAYLKAIAVTNATNLPAVADDSGLCVDALDGAPGLYSARYGPGHDASDKDKYMYLLSKMEGIENRKAKFVSCICCTFPNGDVIRSRGELHGRILTEPVGTGGFGYDPVFFSDEADKPNGLFTTEEKNAISHRGKALRAFVPQLEEYLKK